jgi:two-component system sensor histidine kinase/response regulator
MRFVEKNVDKTIPAGEILNGRRILIVDDDDDITSFLCESLLEEGYSPAGYLSGKAALEALQKEKFDLLLADLMMPEMNGTELVRAALTLDPALVAIIMTGHGTIRAAIEAKRAGAFEYVLKPFKTDDLLATISRAMESRKSHTSDKKQG